MTHEATYPDWNPNESAALPLLGGRTQLFDASVGSRGSTAPLELQIAAQRCELLSAYQLVYDTYLERGYVAPHPGKIVYRSVNGLPSSRTVLACDAAQRVVGTMTLVGDNPQGLPMDAVFGVEVAALRAAGRRVLEISSFAARASTECSSTAVVFALTRFAVQYACWREQHDLLFTVHPRHQRFYERLFNATQLAPCRPHPTMRDNPAIAYRVDLERIDQLPLHRKYFAQAIPVARFDQPPMANEDHRYFCERAAATPEGGAWDEPLCGAE